jgi:hypothetical protein
MLISNKRKKHIESKLNKIVTNLTNLSTDSLNFIRPFIAVHWRVIDYCAHGHRIDANNLSN